MKRAYSLFAKLHADLRGTALVEVALIFPFLALLIFGTMEIGSVIYQQQIITKGVQEAARFAARSTSLVETSTCVPGSANWPTAVTQAKNLATRGDVAGTGSLILPNFTASSLTVSVSCLSATGFVSPNAASGQIPVVVVSANVSAKSMGFLGLVGLSAFTLTASHQEMGIGL
jgi:Flp pilus assembly protein TadG